MFTNRYDDNIISSITSY